VGASLKPKGICDGEERDISYETDAETILITAHDSHLGHLEEGDLGHFHVCPVKDFTATLSVAVV
jgi:hypothetical protein